MSDPVEFFLRESIARARSMSVGDSVIFLRGLLQSCSDTYATQQIRPLFVCLSEIDRRLNLIQSGQMKLHLKERGASLPGNPQRTK